MPIPSYQEIRPQLLLAIHQLGGSTSPKEAVEKTAEIMNLSEEDLNILTQKTGRGAFDIKVRWARQHLKDAGMIGGIQSGVWDLTDAGKEAVKRILAGDNISNVINRSTEETEEINEEPADTNLTDEEQLEIIANIEPDQFERLCAKIFEAMDFENVKYTQRSNDLGIDGYGDLVFGLVKFRVVFQAKKYARNNPVGGPDVQKLDGAMRECGAEKSVFITTSYFTPAAKTSAEKLHVELIDGKRLLETLREKRIGYRERAEFDIDQTFFEKL